MDARALEAPDPRLLDANLAALGALLPQSAKLIHDEHPPPTTTLAAGRDGQLTYAWTDEAGRLRWLGRTSMPSISSAALVDAFEPGSRNVLLAGLGQGAEARLLLDRLAPHQAVMVIEEEAWAAGLSLRLYDLVKDLGRGRFLLFAGPCAWEDFAEFLTSHPGYLTPERMLSWPWFDAKRIAEVSDRLAEIAARVARHRASRNVEDRAARTSRACKSREGVVAVLSNVPIARVRQTAARIAHAARTSNRSCVCFALEDPTMIHPYAVEQALFEAAPAVQLLLDVGPAGLGYDLPPAPVVAICTHRDALGADWVRQLPPETRLAVPSESQRRQLLELGVDARRILLLPPAAIPCPQGQVRRGRRLLVFAEGGDTGPKAAGLHLATHCRLWDAATAIILERCETYHDGQAPDVFAEAERRQKIMLESEEVRQGLIDRIRRILAPALVRAAYCEALVAAGIEFDLYGGGWQGHSILAKLDRGPWPDAAGVAEALIGRGSIVSIEPSGQVQSVLLDGLAAGLAGFVRGHPSDRAVGGLSAVLDPDQHVWRFQTRAELLGLARQFQADPDALADRAGAAARHVNAHHTWLSRLDRLIRFAGGR